jgi:hypothetical protein
MTDAIECEPGQLNALTHPFLRGSEQDTATDNRLGTVRRPTVPEISPASGSPDEYESSNRQQTGHANEDRTKDAKGELL